MMKQKEAYFLIGIGGMGMAPLAIYLHQLGHAVYGYDDNLSLEVKLLLARSGIAIVTEKKIPKDCKKLVISSAISKQHFFYAQAIDRKMPIVRRGELLAEIAKTKKLIAVVGSHGKTSTTAMLIHMLKRLNFSFDYVLGAFFRNDQYLPAESNNSEWLVAEVDESDGTINAFSPAITVIINFDWDHVLLYDTEEKLMKTFRGLLERTFGAVFIPNDNSLYIELAKGLDDVNYFDPALLANVSVKEEGRGLYSLLSDNDIISSGLEGFFNVLNASAAFAVVFKLGLYNGQNLLNGFAGVKRRQDVLFDNKKFKIIADYAHHPNELLALIDYAKQKNSGPLRVVFQPHRYTRTAQYYKEFADALSLADEVVLLPVYAASETASSEGMSDVILEAFHEVYPEKPIRLLENLDNYKLNSDTEGLLLFIGAGDVEKIASQFVYQFRIAMIHEAKNIDYLLQKIGFSGTFSENEPLANKTTMRVGGHARYYIEPANLIELSSILQFADLNSIDVFVLGRGSNLIVSDNGYGGLVVRLNKPYWREVKSYHDLRFLARGGVRLKELCARACAEGVSGFEFMEGIPGSLGGGLRMNAGAMQGEMFDRVEEITFVTLEGKLNTLSKADFDYSYRKCTTLKDAIVVETVLKGDARKEPENIKRDIGEYVLWRKNTQPRESSAGCIFKNPENFSAGKLIDELGLKGHKKGKAEVSGVHANFIINRGGATCCDIIDLIKDIRAKAKDVHDIQLEPEVFLLGEKWEDVL